MSHREDNIASCLTGAGFFFLFCAAMLILGVLPFLASPFAAQYRTEGRRWRGDDLDPFRRAVVFMHTHVLAITSVVGFCIVAGGSLVIVGRKIVPPNPAPKVERESWPESEAAQTRETPDKVLAVSLYGRRFVVPDIAAAIVCAAMSFVSLSFSGIVCGMGMGGFFFFLMLTLHHASCRTILSLRGASLILRQENMFLSRDRAFESVDDVFLAKPVRGHGIMAISIDSVRKEVELYHARPRVNGLCVSSGGRMIHLLLPLPLESLLAVAESLRKVIRDGNFGTTEEGGQQPLPRMKQ